MDMNLSKLWVIVKDREAWSVAVQFSTVQLLSHVRFFTTPRSAALQASLSITSSGSLPKLMSIASVMPSNQLSLSPEPTFNPLLPILGILRVHTAVVQWKEQMFEV